LVSVEWSRRWCVSLRWRNQFFVRISFRAISFQVRCGLIGGSRQTGVHGGMHGPSFWMWPSNACRASRSDAEKRIEIGNCRGNLTCLILPFQPSCVLRDIYFLCFT
jgi:hypothetical protein